MEESETVWALEDEAPVRPGGGGAGEAVEESVEARAVNPGWSPANPSARERKEHEATGHAVYRSWCGRMYQSKRSGPSS